MILTYLNTQKSLTGNHLAWRSAYYNFLNPNLGPEDTTALVRQELCVGLSDLSSPGGSPKVELYTVDGSKANWA